MQLLGLWQSGMVLQRDTENTLYASGAQSAQISFCGQQLQTEQTQNGFAAKIPALSAGGPFEMTISANGEEIKLTDIYIGDVWLLGGQSNMELPIRRTLDVTQADVDNPRKGCIKAFLCPQRYLPHENESLPAQGEWISADTHRILDFSGVGYYLAKFINENQSVPVGIIQTAQGGTRIESWLSAEALKPFKEEYGEYLESTKLKELQEKQEQNARLVQSWHEKLIKQDCGLTQSWQSAVPSGAESAEMPQMFESLIQPGFNGVVWLFNEFELLHEPRTARLLLGTVVDADKTYINGRLVGETTYRYPPRKYDIESGILKKGKNLLAVRVTVSAGKGGLIGGKKYALCTDNGEIALTSGWRYKISVKADKCPEQMFPQSPPAWLYNGMIYPLRGTKLKGAAFYQGESNTAKPALYAEKFLAAASCWRKLFNNDNLPFAYVQIANYDDPFVSGGFAKIRLEQLKAEALLQNGGMAVSVDLGEDNDLHPQDKISVAKRLYTICAKYAYKENINPHSPRPEKAFQAADKLIHIKLANANELTAENGKTELTVNYKTGGRKTHTALISGSCLIIKDADENAQSAEYLNSDAPQETIVYNEKGLACSPFVCNIDATE